MMAGSSTRAPMVRGGANASATWQAAAEGAVTDEADRDEGFDAIFNVESPTRVELERDERQARRRGLAAAY